MRNILKKAHQLLVRPNRRASIERRKIKRLACHQSFLCSDGKTSLPVTVIDIGFGGFKVRSSFPLGKRGDDLHMRRLSLDSTRKLESSYTTGIMVRIAWARKDEDGWESGLYLPAAPGSMRIRWFKELLKELGVDETDIFSRRASRRGRCRLPAVMSTSALPQASGLVMDLSAGGALFAGTASSILGSSGTLSITWGVDKAQFEVTVVGIRPTEPQELEYRYQHSLRFIEPIDKANERTLYRWLEELMRND